MPIPASGFDQLLGNAQGLFAGLQRKFREAPGKFHATMSHPSLLGKFDLLQLGRHLFPMERSEDAQMIAAYLVVHEGYPECFLQHNAEPMYRYTSKPMRASLIVA